MEFPIFLIILLWLFAIMCVLRKKYGHWIFRDFTVVELFIVIMIIGLIASIAIPNSQKAKEHARKNALTKTVEKSR